MSGSVPPDDQATRLEALTQQVDVRKPAADQLAEATHRLGHDDAARRWIAKTIIWIFAISVAVVVGLSVVQSIMTARWDTLETQSADLVKSVVLPVVTLVLGYYFGRSDRGS